MRLAWLWLSPLSFHGAQRDGGFDWPSSTNFDTLCNSHTSQYLSRKKGAPAEAPATNRASQSILHLCEPTLQLGPWMGCCLSVAGGMGVDTIQEPPVSSQLSSSARSSNEGPALVDAAAPVERPRRPSKGKRRNSVCGGEVP
jgi:hypothetical protein